MRGQTRIRLQLDRQGTETLAAGSLVSCTVHIHTNRPIRITSWKVGFRSEGFCTQRRPAHHYDPNPGSSAQHEVCARVDCNLLSQPQQAGKDRAKSLTLHEGVDGDEMSSASREATLRMPSFKLADSWSYAGHIFTARVTNKLVTELKYCRLDTDHGEGPAQESTLKASEQVTVKNNVLVEQFSRHEAAENQAEKIVGLLGFRGPIRCRLTVRDKLAVLGRAVPLLVQIDNDSSCSPRNVSLIFYKEYTFSDFNPQNKRVPMCTRKEKIHSVSLPCVRPGNQWHREIIGFIIPRDCLTSCSLLPCSFVTVRFFLCLKVKSWLDSIKCDVDVFVGTAASEGPLLEASGLQHHLVNHPPPSTDTATSRASSP